MPEFPKANIDVSIKVVVTVLEQTPAPFSISTKDMARLGFVLSPRRILEMRRERIIEKIDESAHPPFKPMTSVMLGTKDQPNRWTILIEIDLENLPTGQQMRDYIDLVEGLVNNEPIVPPEEKDDSET